MVQYGIVGQGLDRGHADEGSEGEVVDAELVPMALEIGLEQGEVLAAEGFQFIELAHARDLFGEHPVEPGIDAVGWSESGQRSWHDWCE